MIRKIVFRGFDSLGAGLRISSERSSTSGGEQRVSSDTIAYRDGDIRYPTGQATARLTYCFVLREGSRAANEAKAKAVINALKGRRGDLADNDLPGKVYKNAIYESAEPLEYVSRSFAAAYMTVFFTADPVSERAGAVNECALRFALRGDFVLIDYNNSSLTVMQNGSTVIGPVSYTAAEPYTYRLVCITENVPTITLGGAEILPDELFEMPNGNAPMYITHSGYGWYELWHDTREVSP